MRQPVVRIPAFLLAMVACATLTHATTVVSLRFDEVVQQAGVIVEGTVTDIQVWPTGADLPPAPADPRPRDPKAPIGAAVEGGRSLFTEVTFQVDSQVGEPVGQQIRFTLAGGSKDGETFKVFGMPAFDVGGRYIVMLRPDFTHTNVPVVGVSQGFFQIASDPATGEEMLLNAEGDIVLGIEGDRLALRHNPATARARTPQLADPPVPAPGSGVVTRTSPRVERYWSSKEAPVRPGTFLDTVRAMKEVQR